MSNILKDANHIIEGNGERQLQDWNNYTLEDNPDFADKFNNMISNEKIPEADKMFTPDILDDTYLNKEVAIARGAGTEEDVQYGKVTKRLRDAEGQPIWTAHENPLLDRWEYDVEFMDGHSKSLSANLIAQYLYAQIDKEGTSESGILWGNNYMLSCHTMSFINFCNAHLYCDGHHILSNNTIKRT